jgi:anti-sigma regulatory factor (Ser/Thr protein kinase)
VSESKPAVEIRLLSDPTYLAGARELVLGLTRRLGFKQDESGRIALAVDEALANVINHGYERQLDKPIWISIWSHASPGVPGLRIVVEDEAKQIDPDAICGRDLDDVKPGGLGVHIIKEVMDSVVYERREKVGMRLIMTKALTPNSTNAPEHANG